MEDYFTVPLLAALEFPHWCVTQRSKMHIWRKLLTSIFSMFRQDLSLSIDAIAARSQ